MHERPRTDVKDKYHKSKKCGQAAGGDGGYK